MDCRTRPLITLLSMLMLVTLLGRLPALAQSPTYSLLDLGTLDKGRSSQAFALNLFDEVVGVSDTPALNASGGVVTHAFLWSSGGGMVDLNTQLAARSGWVLQTAMAINDFGDIVGQGLHHGKSHAVLLIPVVLQTFTLSPNPVAGGQNVVGTLTLSAPAPFALPLSLSSSKGG